MSQVNFSSSPRVKFTKSLVTCHCILLALSPLPLVLVKHIKTSSAKHLVARDGDDDRLARPGEYFDSLFSVSGTNGGNGELGGLGRLGELGGLGGDVDTCKGLDDDDADIEEVNDTNATPKSWAETNGFIAQLCDNNDDDELTN